MIFLYANNLLIQPCQNTPNHTKKKNIQKKLVTASTSEPTGIPSTFTPPSNTTENSHLSSPKGQYNISLGAICSRSSAG